MPARYGVWLTMSFWCAKRPQKAALAHQNDMDSNLPRRRDAVTPKAPERSEGAALGRLTAARRRGSPCERRRHARHYLHNFANTGLSP
jgi:hypothetical protein